MAQTLSLSDLGVVVGAPPMSLETLSGLAQGERPSLLQKLGQTWPAQMAKSAYDAVRLPGQVAGGIMGVEPAQPGMWSDVDEARQQANQSTMMNRAADLGGLVMGGAYGMAPAGALGMAGGKIHEYAPMYRPVGSATLPDGFTGLRPATSEHKFGVAQYEKPLSFKDIERFELVPLDPKHPFNLKKSFEDFRDKFMNEFASANETYRSKNGDFMVTPNLSGDGWQVTYFSGKTPTGHHVVNDFDELAREVWGKDFYPGKGVGQTLGSGATDAKGGLLVGGVNSLKEARK